MEQAIHERFSRRSLGPRLSPLLQALSQSTYNTYKFVHHNFFDILRRRLRGPSSSFNNPYFRREKVSRRKRATVLRVFLLFLANYKLNYSTFVGNAKFPKTHGYESLTVIYVLLARSLGDEKKKILTLFAFFYLSRRAFFFLFFILNAPYLRVASAAKSCIVTTTFKSHL